jgi:hypothetical protein
MYLPEPGFLLEAFVGSPELQILRHTPDEAGKRGSRPENSWSEAVIGQIQHPPIAPDPR